MKAIERVTSKINETKRKEENASLVSDLENRIINYEKLMIKDLGELLHHDKFIVVGKDQKERELQLFLFNKIIFSLETLPNI